MTECLEAFSSRCTVRNLEIDKCIVQVKNENEKMESGFGNHANVTLHQEDAALLMLNTRWTMIICVS